MAGKTFSADAARRLADVTRRIEQTPRSRPKRRPPPKIAIGAKYAVVTTPITAANRAAGTLGKGVGTLMTVTYDSADNATYKSTGISVPLYSGAVAGTGVPIAAGRLVMGDFYDGRLNVVVDFCS